jgi:hypothetical protein
MLPLPLINAETICNCPKFFTNRYKTKMLLLAAPLGNDELADGFTSRTDYTRRTLTVEALPGATTWGTAHNLNPTSSSGGLSFTIKLMHVWNQLPGTVSGHLFTGVGLRVNLNDDVLEIQVFNDGTESFEAVSDQGGSGLRVKDYHCNQLAVVIPHDGGAARFYLGKASVSVPELTIGVANAWAQKDDGTSDTPDFFVVGPLNAKVWDVRLFGESRGPGQAWGSGGRALGVDEINKIGIRCGDPGEYVLSTIIDNKAVEKVPLSGRYAYGMGGTSVNPNHETQAFASGVYSSFRIQPVVR